MPAVPPRAPRKPADEPTSDNIEHLDDYLVATASRILLQQSVTPLHTLYEQYRSRASYVLTDVLEYEGNPASQRRADTSHLNVDPKLGMGDGTVLVVHLQQSLDGGLQKMTVCSGFAIAVKGEKLRNADVVVTCAHTLEEVRAFLMISINVPDLIKVHRSNAMLDIISPLVHPSPSSFSVPAHLRGRSLGSCPLHHAPTFSFWNVHELCLSRLYVHFQSPPFLSLSVIPFSPISSERLMLR
jgi:hypothetical protein